MHSMSPVHALQALSAQRGPCAVYSPSCRAFAGIPDGDTDTPAWDTRATLAAIDWSSLTHDQALDYATRGLTSLEDDCGAVSLSVPGCSVVCSDPDTTSAGTPASGEGVPHPAQFQDADGAGAGAEAARKRARVEADLEAPRPAVQPPGPVAEVKNPLTFGVVLQPGSRAHRDASNVFSTLCQQPLQALCSATRWVRGACRYVVDDTFVACSA